MRRGRAVKGADGARGAPTACARRHRARIRVAGNDGGALTKRTNLVAVGPGCGQTVGQERALEPLRRDRSRRRVARVGAQLSSDPDARATGPSPGSASTRRGVRRSTSFGRDGVVVARANSAEKLPWRGPLREANLPLDRSIAVCGDVKPPCRWRLRLWVQSPSHQLRCSAGSWAPERRLDPLRSRNDARRARRRPP